MKYVYDTEIIGDENPVFLVCVQEVASGKTTSFWMHKKGDMKRMEKLFGDPSNTFISFNGINFDQPLISAAVGGADEVWLKDVANKIIETGMNSWQTYRQFGIEFFNFDHIDLKETAPGVMISLKTYAGRMGYPTMVDMPFEHDKDITPKQHKVLEQYCINDLGVTLELYRMLESQIKLREELGAEYGVDLRSKSDAQCAEAILKSKLNIRGGGDKNIPRYVRYTAPKWIKPKSEILKDLIIKLEEHEFKINHANGSPEIPSWLSESVYKLGDGLYQVGIGGLHSVHDKKVYLEATKDTSLSDFDVASYYPNIIMACGLIPRLGGNRGDQFIEAYGTIYKQRIEAKHKGDKVTANTLKIVLNGTYGKLGSVYSAFYSPDLMLAVTLTGQLNLLWLIDELVRIKSVSVVSANTDGILLHYPNTVREKVLKVFADNVKKTGFEYEETPYVKYAAKDVNNYIALKPDGKAKRKGLYGVGCVSSPESPTGKNPAMNVSANLAVDYLREGIMDISRYDNILDYVAVRNVKGRGVQHPRFKHVDDWENIEKGLWHSPATGKTAKRVSRPDPLQVGEGGEPFGRVARWYMSTQLMPPITYVNNGSRVPKTEGGKLCLTLPSKLPKDIDKQWYLDEAKSMLNDMGVNIL